MWSKCYCRTPKVKQFITIKCKVQNNRKIQETQTSVTSTTKAEQDNSYIPGGFSTKIIHMLILQAMDQFPKYKHKICAKQSPLFPMLMCKLL